MFKKIFKFIVILILIFGWMFSYPPDFFENLGGLRVWQNPRIPPEIEEVQADPDTERQSPDALLQQDNLSGALADIDEDPDSPGADWLTYTANNVDTVTRVSFPPPTGDPAQGVGLQNFKIWVRQQPDGAGVDPTVAVSLYENGALVAEIMSAAAVSSASGQLFSATWNANLLSNADGSGVECYIYGDAVGGAPGDRCTVEVGAVEWNVDYVLSTPPTGSFNSAVQKTDGTGKVDISIEVDDLNDDDCKALIEYTSDGNCSSGWETTPNVTLVGPATADVNDSGGPPDINNSAAYQVGSGSTTRIDTGSGSNTVQFDWDSATDESTGNGTYCLRLTVNDDTYDQTTSATSTLTIDNVNPGTPGNLTDGGKTTDSITLTFGSVSSDTNEPGTDAYKIFYKEGASGVTEANTEHDDTDLNSYNYGGTSTTTVTGLNYNTQYVFNIWAYDTFGNKASATEVSITTDAPSTYGNIDSTYKYAWGENVGWTNWRPYYGGVTVYSECLTGYTWNENVGWIKTGDNSSNCTNNDCCQNGTTKGYENDSNSADDDGDGEVDDWGVNNDGSGNLSGYAWGENIGWLNFDDTSANNYSQVVIDGSGNFTNYAWGENVGWVNMSCDNNSYCGTVLYRVKTSWTGSANSAPSFTAGPSDGGSSGASPTNVGSNVSFSGTATDSSDSWKLLLCSTSTAPTASTSTPACAGGSGNLWCVDDTWRASTVESSCLYTATSSDVESNAWWAFACDNNASPECSTSSQGTPDGGTDSPFKVNHRPDFTALDISKQ